MIRVRVVRRPPLSTLDGFSLTRFEVGRDYEVGNQLGALLLAEGWAVPVPLDAPPPVVPFGPDDPYDMRLLDRKRRPSSPPPSSPRDRATDTPHRRRRRKTERPREIDGLGQDFR